MIQKLREKDMNKVYYSRDEMQKINTEKLLERGVTIEEIAKIAYQQQYLSLIHI